PREGGGGTSAGPGNPRPPQKNNLQPYGLSRNLSRFHSALSPTPLPYVPFLEFLSSLDDFPAGIRALDRLTQPRPVKGRNLRGLNFFSRVEQRLLAALQRPGFNIAGLRRADLRPLLTQCSPATLSRQLARLRQLGVIKRVTGTYRY